MIDDAPTAWDRALAEHEASLLSAWRVQVRLSGECRQMLRWHGTIEDGARGIVIARDTRVNGAPEDHPFLVWFDRPLEGGRRSWNYSAAELIPITVEEAMAEVVGTPLPDADAEVLNCACCGDLVLQTRGSHRGNPPRWCCQECTGDATCSWCSVKYGR